MSPRLEGAEHPSCNRPILPEPCRSRTTRRRKRDDLPSRDTFDAEYENGSECHGLIGVGSFVIFALAPNPKSGARGLKCDPPAGNAASRFPLQAVVVAALRKPNMVPPPPATFMSDTRRQPKGSRRVV